MPRPLVYITRTIPPAARARIEAECEVLQWDDDEPVPYDLLKMALAESEVRGLYCLLTDRIDAELLDAAPHLKVVSQMAVGYDNIDIAACSQRNIVVGNTPGVLTETTADLAWALMMATARRVVESAEAVKDGQWKTWSPMWMTGPDIHGATLGIIGMGRIGAAFARRAQGFGMRLLYHNRSPKAEATALGATLTDIDTLLAESDFVALHCPLTEETRGMVDEGFLRKMKPTAILVNTSRGAVVNEKALYRALSEGWIHAAGLDVTEVEPIPMDSPLLELENCLILPHIGSASIPTRTKMATIAAENLISGVLGMDLPHPVNAESVARG